MESPNTPLVLLSERSFIGIKPFLLSLSKMTWFSIYSSLITLLQISFLFYDYIGTLILNIVFLFNQLITIVIVFLLKNQNNSTVLFKICNTEKYRSIFFSVVFLINFTVSLLVYNDSFNSYNPYEVYFAYFFSFTNIIRIVLLIITGSITLKSIDKSD